LYKPSKKNLFFNSLAFTGLSLSFYYSKSYILDEFYEKTIKADFKDGEKREI